MITENPKKPVLNSLAQLVILLIKIGLWGFAAFVGIGSLYGACHGDLTMSVTFSIVLLALVGFNKIIKGIYKWVGIAATFIIFVSLVSFSQSSAGRASHTAMLRQNAINKAQEQALEARRNKEEMKKHKQEANRAKISTFDTLQTDFINISIGDPQSKVRELMGRSPDLTYLATNGTGATVLQYKDAEVNVLRFMMINGVVSKVTYVPTDGGLGAMQVKPPIVGANDTTELDAQSTSGNTMASMLASIDAGQFVAPSDPIVSKYQTQFDSLHTICPQARDAGISDMAVHTQKIELEHGVDETALSILEAVNQACQQSNSWQGKDVADMMAAYGVLRAKGMTRDQAIAEAETLADQIDK